MVWFLEPESLNIGYLDPLGYDVWSHSYFWLPALNLADGNCLPTEPTFLTDKAWILKKDFGRGS